MALYARGNPAHWWKTRSCGKGSRAPGAMFVSPLRRTISTCSLLALSVTLAGGWYMTRPARISRLAETLLSQVMSGKVTVGSGHLSLSGTLLLSDVDVKTQPDPGQIALPLFSADQIEVRFDWLSLLVGELRSTQLTALRPTLYLIEDHDLGKWNYELLHKKPATTKPVGPARKLSSLPVIALREARVQWGEVNKSHLTETAAATIDGQFTPSSTSPAAYNFSLAQRTENPNPLKPAAEPPQPIVVTGTFDVNDDRLSARTDEIRLNNSVRDALPSSIRTWWNEHDLSGTFSQLWITLDNDNGLQVGAEADHLGMVLKATPSADGKLYSVKLADIRGKFAFGVTKPDVKIEGLEGRVLGFRFLADGDIGGADPNALALNIRFPNAVIGDDYPPIFMAFPPSQDLMQRLAPHGKFDISIELRRGDMGGVGGPNSETKLLVNGTVLCHDARMRFGPIPYPLTHLNGPIDFTQESVTFRNVTAQADESLVHMDGTTGTNPSFPKIDFKVWSDNAVFDDRLAACLPEKFLNVWNQFVIEARGTFVCTVKRDTDFTAPPDVRVYITVADGEGYAKAFPYPFHNAHGSLALSADKTDVKQLTLDCGGGAEGSGQIRLDGVIHHPGGDVSNLLPDLTVNADIPLSARLIQSLPPEASDLLKGLIVAGHVTFDGTVERHPAQPGDALAGMHLVGAVGMRDGSVKAADGTWALSQIAVKSDLHDENLQLISASADILNGIHLTAAGNLDLITKTGALQLNADAQHLQLPADAPHFAPAAARDMWTTYHPAGPIDLQAQAHITLGTPKENPATPDAFPGIHIDTYSAAVTAQGLTLTNADWPTTIDDIHGELHATPGQLLLQNITAKTGPASISADANYTPDTGACTLTATLTSQGLPTAWMTKLPSGLRTFFDTHQATGNLALTIDHMTRDRAADPWKFKAALNATHVSVATTSPTPTTKSSPVPPNGLATSRPALSPVTPDPFAVTADKLTLVGTGTLAGSTLDFDGKLNSSTVGIVGVTLDSLASDVTLSSTEHVLRLSNINGLVAGGSLQGTIRVELDNDGRYEGDLSLKDAALAGLVLPPSASADERNKVGDGRVSATLTVQQTFGPNADRTGRGELIVQDGKIYNVPLAMGLMQVATLRLPVARAFDRAEMNYFLRDNKVTFEKILLESDSIDLAGSGTLSLKNKALDLNFVTESPNEIKLPIISPIINTIRSELLQLAVTGTIDNPKVTPVPLSALATPLRALLPHHLQASEK